jgi:hypothetical protein
MGAVKASPKRSVECTQCALNVPVDVQSKITSGVVQHFLKMPIPGKIQSHAL